jgi:hypothetical protein
MNIEELDDSEDFVEFCIASSLARSGSGATAGLNIKNGGDKLFPNTIRRAKKMFDIFVEANLLRDVRIEDLNFENPESSPTAPVIKSQVLDRNSVPQQRQEKGDRKIKRNKTRPVDSDDENM